jgi:hypothetical protein
MKKETSKEISDKGEQKENKKEIETSKEVKVRREQRHCLHQRVFNE